MNKRFSVQQRTAFPCQPSHFQACHPSASASQSPMIHQFLFLFSITAVPLQFFPIDHVTFLRNSASEQCTRRKTLLMTLLILTQPQIFLTIMIFPWMVLDKIRFHHHRPLHSNHLSKCLLTASFT